MAKLGGGAGGDGYTQTGPRNGLFVRRGGVSRRQARHRQPVTVAVTVVIIVPVFHLGAPNFYLAAAFSSESSRAVPAAGESRTLPPPPPPPSFIMRGPSAPPLASIPEPVVVVFHAGAGGVASADGGVDIASAVDFAASAAAAATSAAVVVHASAVVVDCSGSWGCRCWSSAPAVRPALCLRLLLRMPPAAGSHRPLGGVVVRGWDATTYVISVLAE